MTAKRDLKKRVRERQERTGESYTTARAHVLAGREPDEPVHEPMDVLEMVELTDEAERLGLRCRVSMTPRLAGRVDGSTVLARLRAALLATAGDASTELLRAVLLRGEAVPAGAPTVTGLAVLDVVRRFMARARAGVAGPSESGRMLALHVDGKQGGETVVFVLSPPLPSYVTGRLPTLLVTLPEPVLVQDFHIWACWP